jgi:hypothetical protein
MSGPSNHKNAFGTLWEEITSLNFKLGYRLIAWRNKHYADSQIMITFEGGKNSPDGWVRIDWYTIKREWYATGRIDPEEELRIAKLMLERARNLIFFSMSEDKTNE